MSPVTIWLWEETLKGKLKQFHTIVEWFVMTKMVGHAATHFKEFLLSATIASLRKFTVFRRSLKSLWYSLYRIFLLLILLAVSCLILSDPDWDTLSWQKRKASTNYNFTIFSHTNPYINMFYLKLFPFFSILHKWCIQGFPCCTSSGLKFF